MSRGKHLIRGSLLVATSVFVTAAIFELGRGSSPSSVVAGRGVSSRGVLAVVSRTPEQRLMGFGASGAWWSGPIYSFSNSAKAELGRLLFSKNGLALSQFRYNIGGGGSGVITSWKAPPTVLTPSGGIDLSKDPAGIYFLEMAKSYGVHSLVGFVNSAPPYFTSNNLTCGGFLIPSLVPRYAAYLSQVVTDLQSKLGIKLSYISPMNEPDSSEPSCKQEGMVVPVSLRAQVVTDLGQDLARQAPWCKVIADESSTVARLLRQFPRWGTSPTVLRYLAAVAHHGYDFPDPRELTKLGALAQQVHKPLWATEICCYNGSHFGYLYDPTMESAIWLAETVYRDLTFAHDAAFDWWTAASPDLGCDPSASPNCWAQPNLLGRNDGLVYYDLQGTKSGNEHFYLPKRYFVFGNFSRFIRPGAVLFPVYTDNSKIQIIATRLSTKWVVVVINSSHGGSAPLSTLIRFPVPIEKLFATGAWVTSSSRSLVPTLPATMTSEGASILSKSMSVTTYTFSQNS